MAHRAAGKRYLVLTSSAIAAIAVLSTVRVMSAPRPRGQSTPAASPVAATPAFEVASVKPTKPGDDRSGLAFQPGGRFTANNLSLRQLIGFAYGAARPLPEFQILGGPNWIGTDRFDILAKAERDTAEPGAASPAASGGANIPPQVLRLMLQALLADRFQLKVHSESRELPIYALVMSSVDRKIGSRLRPSTADCAALFAARRAARGNGPPQGPPPEERPLCGIRVAPGNMSGGTIALSQLTNALSGFVDRVVLDRTALSGTFDLDLQWTPDQSANPSLATLRGGSPPPPPTDGPSLFAALQEQLGLRLESTKGPVDIVVIEGAERPKGD